MAHPPLILAVLTESAFLDQVLRDFWWFSVIHSVNYICYCAGGLCWALLQTLGLEK